MLKSQKLLLEQSEKREKINGLLAKDELTNEERSELATLTGRMQETEVEYRAAIVAEESDLEKRKADGGDGLDPEERERMELRSKSKFANFVGAAMENRAAVGAEAEYMAALGMPGVGLNGGTAFPLSMLAPPEVRAETDAETTVMPRRWLDRLFADTAAMALGVTFESVPAGVASYPVTTAGASAEQRGREEAATDAAWTIGTTELKPTRNAVRAVFTIEDAARIPGLESALVRDLRMALVEGVDRAIFLGDDGANENVADITGLQTAGIDETTITQANKIKGPETLTAFTGMVDGIHAAGLADLRVVAAIGAWRLWETTIINSAAENQTLAAFLRTAGLSWRSRGEIETATANGDFGAFVGLAKGIQGAAVAPHWETAELIRDPYTKSSSGEVALTLCTLWNFGLPRTANFKRIKFVA